MIGAVAVALNAFSEADILLFCIQHVQCKVVIADVERFRRIQPELDTLWKQGIESVIVVPRENRKTVPKQERDWTRLNNVADWDSLQEKYKDSTVQELLSITILPEGTILSSYTLYREQRLPPLASDLVFYFLFSLFQTTLQFSSLQELLGNPKLSFLLSDRTSLACS